MNSSDVAADEISDEEKENVNRLLVEERTRCDALAADNDSMFRLIEDTRTQNLQNENNLQDEILNKNKQIEELTSQINFLRDQIQKQDDRQVCQFCLNNPFQICFSFFF